jgi:hypothetical protein
LLFEVGTLALALLVGISLYSADERKEESRPSTLPARDSTKTKPSDPKLKKRGRRLITELRELQTRFDKAGQNAKSFETSWAALDREFKKKFYNEAVVVERELVARLGRQRQKQDKHDLINITAYSVLRHGSAVGANPFSAVATYLERMLNQIP